MGSGVRLLPLMAGLALGAVLADRVAARVTTKLTAALGFTLLTCGLVLGATMTVASGNAFIATWTAITGVGFGLALATAASTALVDLPKDRAGVGSAVMQAVQKAGAPLSAAILGSVLSVAYHSQLDLAGLPAPAASAVRSGVFSGLAVARGTGSAALLDSVRSAFVHGTDAMLWVSAGVGVAGIVLALRFCPGAPSRTREPVAATGEGLEGAECPMSVLPDAAPGRPGLRERKKARTRAAIREHALRLFREQGYDATTVEQIAEAAEVSPSTFFRYFPTKEDVVLQDDMDLLWMDVFRAQPPDLGPIAAMRTAVHTAFEGMAASELDQLRETMDMTMAIPAVQARMMEEFARTTERIAEALAERSGKDASDFAVRRSPVPSSGSRWLPGSTTPVTWMGSAAGSSAAWPCWRLACRCNVGRDCPG